MGPRREVGPGDVGDIPTPGHDAWTVGDEACVHRRLRRHLTGYAVRQLTSAALPGQIGALRPHPPVGAEAQHPCGNVPPLATDAPGRLGRGGRLRLVEAFCDAFPFDRFVNVGFRAVAT